MQEFFKHIDLLQSKLADQRPEALSEHSVDFLDTCTQDIGLLRRLCETQHFQDTLGLYNKIILISGRLQLKPLSASLRPLSAEVSRDLLFIQINHIFTLKCFF